MSDTIANLVRKIKNAKNLKTVVHTMKVLAASNISQYEQSVHALTHYYRSVELGLATYLKKINSKILENKQLMNQSTSSIEVIIFGSDQGLVQQFNEVIADYMIKQFALFSSFPRIWAVGEHIYKELEKKEIPVKGIFSVPNSIQGITTLIGQMLKENEIFYQGKDIELYIFYNRSTSSIVYEPINHRLLPLDENWLKKYVNISWPTKNLPEVVGDMTTTLQALINEYLFVSLFQACAESLACENACRLSAMQRASKNIDELLGDLNKKFHRLRQSSIDAELSDVISGFESTKN